MKVTVQGVIYGVINLVNNEEAEVVVKTEEPPDAEATVITKEGNEYKLPLTHDEAKKLRRGDECEFSIEVKEHGN